MLAEDFMTTSESAYARAGKRIWEILSEMKEGDQLAPERQLCVQLGVSRVTLRRALEPFHRNGILRASQGGGTWLVKELPPPSRPQSAAARFIGLVVPSVENKLIARIVRGAEQCATEREFHVALAHDHGDMENQILQLRRMADGGVGGIAVYPDTDNLNRPEFLEVIRQIQSCDIPLLMIDRYLPEADSPSVLSNNIDGMYSATEHMILSGHRRLALLAFGPTGGIADRERRKGFLAALGDYKLPSNPVCSADVGTREHEEKAYEVVRDWIVAFNGVIPFDGIVCLQDNMAYGAYLALRDSGIRGPQDVGLIGYDNLDRELFRASGLELSSIDQPAEEIGFEAAKRLIAVIEGERISGRAKHLLLKPRLIVRTSCGS